MERFNYWLARFVGRLIFFCTMRVQVVRGEAASQPGGYVLACTHISHLDPICLTVITRRKIDWMARIEFFRWKVIALFLRAIGTFSVNRSGIPVKAIRKAIEKARAGRVVGIFPEGGVAQGRASACRGGPIRKGACLVSRRAQVPILPCVILGTHRLNEAIPWLPLKATRLWVIFGRRIEPLADPSVCRRDARERMGRELQQEFVSIYNELRESYHIDDSWIP